MGKIYRPYQVLKACLSWRLSKLLNVCACRWEDRLKPNNHHIFFPYFTTCIWDSTCIRVQEPRSPELKRLVCNGHYDFACFLVLIAITFTGEIVYASGLCRSRAYDAHIYDDTYHQHPQFSWERNIGDGHFTTCASFDTPISRPSIVSARDLTWNAMLQLLRSRIEHVNRVIKGHTMFEGRFRGFVRHLCAFVKISVHGAAVRLRLSGGRYEGFGNWPHSG